MLTEPAMEATRLCSESAIGRKRDTVEDWAAPRAARPRRGRVIEIMLIW